MFPKVNELYEVMEQSGYDLPVKVCIQACNTRVFDCVLVCASVLMSNIYFPHRLKQELKSHRQYNDV